MKTFTNQADPVYIHGRKVFNRTARFYFPMENHSIIGRFSTKTLFFFIILLGILLRMTFFSGITTSDDLAYSRYSHNLLYGIIDESSPILFARVGITYPTALAYAIFGVNDFSSVLFVFLTSIGNIILAYYFGKLLHSEKAGLMASFLMSDLPAAFFIGLGVYAFLQAEIKSKSPSHYLISGLLIGIGFFIRETAILIALFFLGYIAYSRKIRVRFFLVPIGFLLIFAMDMLILHTLTGDFFYRFTIVPEIVSQEYAYFNYYGRLDFPTSLFHYPYVILTNGLLTVPFLLAFVSIFYILFTKQKHAYPLVLWLVPVLLYLSFGSTSLSNYIPFRADPRYFSIIIMPGILLSSFFLIDGNRTIKKFIMPLSINALLIVSAVYSYPNTINPASDNLRELYPQLSEQKLPIYTDGRSLLVLNYLSDYRAAIPLLEYPHNLSSVQNAYILINTDMILRIRESDKKIEFPEETSSPPKSWQLILRTANSEEENKGAALYLSP
jgi:hypothetical protein